MSKLRFCKRGKERVSKKVGVRGAGAPAKVWGTLQQHGCSTNESMTAGEGHSMVVAAAVAGDEAVASCRRRASDSPPNPQERNRLDSL